MAKFWSIFFVLLFQEAIFSRANYDVSFGDLCGETDDVSYECDESEALTKKRIKAINLGGNKRIVNGCPIKQIPWYAQMITKTGASTVKCGATFINKFWILSAVHCFCNPLLPCKKDPSTGGLIVDYDPKSYHEVLLPMYTKVAGTGSVLNLTTIVLHPEYNNETMTMDFALAQLSYPIADNAYGVGFYTSYSTSTVMPICLPNSANFPDLEKHVTVAGRGVQFQTCNTNGNGPEVFQPCAKKWVTLSKSADDLKDARDMTCMSSEVPSRNNKECKVFRIWLKGLGERASSTLTKEEKILFDMNQDLHEVVLVEDKELKSKQSGYNKTNCFVTQGAPWCGVCDPEAEEGMSGYCADGKTATDISADRGWGFCDTGCLGNKPKFTENLQIAKLYTFNSSMCAELMNKTKNKVGNKRLSFDAENEICAGYVRNIRAPVIVFTKLDSGNFSFTMKDIDHPELKTIRMKNTIFEADQLIGGVDSCSGDSGGPLWTDEEVYANGSKRKKAHLVGVVSRGIDCGQKDHPGIYGRVKTILPWIKKVASAPAKYAKKRFGMTEPSEDIEELMEHEVRTIDPYYSKFPDRSENKKKPKENTKKTKSRKKKKKPGKRKKKYKKPGKRKNRKGKHKKKKKKN